jgi:hypothetical protein
LVQSPWAGTELAYLAGIIDGEGSFVLHNHGNHKFGCSLNVGNTDPRLLHWIQARFGGSVRHEGRASMRWKPVYRWKANATDLDTIITAVLPFLVIKRDRAELMLAYRRTLNPPISGQRTADVTPDSVKSERRDLHAQLAILNRRGA